MKSIVRIVVFAAAVAAPMLSFAQTTPPVTRAQVRAEMSQLEKAGYNPSTAGAFYPSGLQAAEARVETQNTPAQVAHANGSSAADGTATQ